METPGILHLLLGMTPFLAGLRNFTFSTLSVCLAKLLIYSAVMQDLMRIKPINWLFPRKTSKYVTILRNPEDSYESVFNFAQLGKSLGLGVALDSLEKLLDKPIESYNH